MRRQKRVTPDASLTELLKKSGSNNRQEALAAQHELAIALQGPIREGVLDGDIVSQIFTSTDFNTNQIISYPLDLLVPGTEGDYTAYTIPNHGRIPERHIEADELTIQTYDVGSSIDWLLKFARDARWDVVGRGTAILETSFVRKKNIDGWQTIIAAGVDRNVVVYDSAAGAGLFTKRLVSLMQLSMRRTNAGNTAAIQPIRLTDLFVSPEGMEDMRAWDLTIIDDVTRREIFKSTQTGGLQNIFGVDLHETLELGVGQLHQKYFEDLGGSYGPSSDEELVIGLDLTSPDVFVNPVRQPIEIFEDETLHRQRRAGFYGWGEHGFAVLDNRRILLGSF